MSVPPRACNESKDLAVSNRENRHIALVVLHSLGWPLLWGSCACVGFYALIHTDIIRDELVRRYFAGHPVEYVEAWLFFVGLAALILKGLHIAGQFATLQRQDLLGPRELSKQVEHAPAMLEALGQLPRRLRSSYLVRRLNDALDHVVRKGSADRLDEELKYLADLDAARQHEGYALVRIITWATPMLGFLGTVIGITLALGDLSPQALVNSPEEAMQGLLAGLSVAFDTTALALSLSILLMFIQFMVNQVEGELLSAVDTRTTAELVGRFEEYGTQTDPHLASVRRMADSVVKSSEQLVQRQAKLWQQTIQEAQQQWQQVSMASQRQLETGLAGALQRSVQEHAAQLTKNAEASQRQTERTWERLLQGLAENARVIQAQQSEMAKQGDVMLKVVRASGDIVKLEHALNKNLQALAGARNFEETVMSLSATIHLLNARWKDDKTQVPPITLESPAREERAA
jgi:biopolymer transport protein ExbB/TolQ